MATSPQDLYSDFYSKGKNSPVIAKLPDPKDAEQLTVSDNKYDDSTPFTATLANDLKKSFGGLMGFPSDLLNSALTLYSKGIDAVGSLIGDKPIDRNVTKPFMGSKDIQDRIGYDPNLKPANFGQHAASTLLSSTAMGGPFAMAAKTKGAISAAGELLSGFGSGGGQIVAEEVAPGNPYVEVGAQLLGGLSPTVMAGRVQAAKDLLPPASKFNLKDARETSEGLLKRYSQSYVDERMKGSLEGMDPTKVMDNMTEAERLEGKFPGLNLSLDQRTGSPEVRSIASNVAHSSGKNLNERFSLDVANRERIASEANNVPKSTMTWDEALDQPKQQINTAMGDIDTKLSSLDNQMEGLVRDSAGAPQDKTGARLRMIRNEEKKLAKATVQRQFGEVDSLSKKYDAKVDAGGIMSTVEEKLADPIFKFDPTTVPSVFNRAKELQVEMKMNRDSAGKFIGGQTAKVPFAEAKALREAVGSDIAAEMSSTRINPRRLRALFQVRKEIDGAMDTMGATQFPDLNAAYKTAIKDYREKYVPRFERGVNLKMSILNSLGDMRIPDEGVIKAYFKPNGITPIRQYKELFGNHPAAVETMENGVMNLFSKDVVKDGVVNPTRYNAFMSKYGTVLDELPNLKGRIGNVGQAAESIAAQRSALFDQAREINQGILAKVLKVENPEKVLDKALADPKTMTELVKSFNPEARKSLASSVMLKAFDESKMANPEFVAIDPVKLGDWLSRNEKTMQLALKSAYGEKVANEHIKNLQDIQKASSFIERTPISSSSTESIPAFNVDPLKKRTGVSTSSVFAAARAATAGRGGAEYFAGIFGGQLMNFLSQKQIAELTKQALYDPATAKALVAGMKESTLSTDVKRNLQTAAQKLGYLITGGPDVSMLTARKIPAYGINTRTQQNNPAQQQDEQESMGLNLDEEP